MNTAAISTLNSLLIDEITAAQSYKQALREFPAMDMEAEFKELQNAHQERVHRLKKRLRELGGTALEQTGRVVLDLNACADQAEAFLLDAFEDLEFHGLQSYEASLSALDEQSKTLIMYELLPAQEVTHNVVFTLRSGMVLLAKSA